VLDPEVLLRVLEEHRLRKDGKYLWAVETMLEAGVDRTRLLREYIKAFEKPDVQEMTDLKCGFACAIGFLVSQKADCRDLEGELNYVKQWFMSHGRGCSDPGAAVALVNAI
jgi:hypothetical protein